MSEQQQEPFFSIEKLYLKGLSLEIPNAPRIFLEREAPNIDVQLNTDTMVIDEGLYEISLTITATAKLQDKTMFLVEAVQAGIFQIRNVAQDDLKPVLGITCPNIIFPYAREAISDVVTRSGFPPLILNPVSFEALYQQRETEASSQPAH